MDAKETTFYTSVLIICAVLGIIITYFIISIIRQHRRSLQLHKQSIYMEITTLEKERARMAADLHDEVGPILSAVKLRLNSLDIHNEADAQEVETTNQQIDQLLKRMREISFDLMPTSLIRKGLPAALNEFIEYCNKSNELNIRFQYEEVELSQQQAINLYRIIQEIIHNTKGIFIGGCIEIQCAPQKMIYRIGHKKLVCGSSIATDFKEYTLYFIWSQHHRIQDFGGFRTVLVG